MTSQFHRNFFVNILLFNLSLFDKLFDLKVVTAFYDSFPPLWIVYKRFVIIQYDTISISVRLKNLVKLLVNTYE